MISVVIPLYNGENFIGDTLRDIQKSTEPDFEILVIDDGSKDNGAAIVQKMAVSDSRIKYFKKENGGIVSARNYGLERAVGEYICFVDQDDFVYPDMLEVMSSDMKATGADMVRANYAESTDGTVPQDNVASQTIVVKRGTKTYDYYLQALVMRGTAPHREYPTDVSIWSCMFKTAVLKDNGIYFESFCDYEDDWIASIKIFLASKIVCFESRTVYCWRVHNASESHNRVAKDRYIDDFYRKYCSLRKFLLDSVAETGLTERERKVFSRELQKRAMLWTLSNETGRGIEGRTIEDSVVIVKEAAAKEKAAGLYRGLITHSISTTGYGVSGAKKLYHKLREALLTFLIINNMESVAVKLNKKYLHGRWHI